MKEQMYICKNANKCENKCRHGTDHTGEYRCEKSHCDRANLKLECIPIPVKKTKTFNYKKAKEKIKERCMYAGITADAIISIINQNIKEE